MTTLRRFTCNDLFNYNNVNLDILTETYNLPFYLTYLAKWPEYCLMAEGPGKQAMGVHDCYFVDLFVRKSNAVAIAMYGKFGYIVYRTVTGYYSGDEDAYDMRKALQRDASRRSVVPLKKAIRPEDLEWE
eukprot:XP_001694221.1 N-acetyl-transferase-like protein [Chlamydomonas reinhardtii]